MEKVGLENLRNLAVCHKCGCVFGIIEATESWAEDSVIAVCPACKQEYEIEHI